MIAPSYGQQSELLNFSEEVSIEGTTKDALYNRAKALFSEKYNNDPYYLRMNKNLGSLKGSGSEDIDVRCKELSPTLNFKVIMVLRENGYTLELTDFYCNEASKSGKKGKKYLKRNADHRESRKAKNLQKKLNMEANLIAQEIKEEIKRNMNNFVANQNVP